MEQLKHECGVAMVRLVNQAFVNYVEMTMGSR